MVGPGDAETDFGTDWSRTEFFADAEASSRSNHMRILYSVGLALALPGCLFGQGVQQKPKFMESAVVEHHGTFATVTASDPRPLLQVITALREEYGWVIDFEDPPYDSKYDLADDTDPGWRAIHPGLPGVLRIAGAGFRSDFPETATTVPSSTGVMNVLQKVVKDYNVSGNPGKFAVRKESAARYSIIGISKKDGAGRDQPVGSILDTPITMSTEKRGAVETVYLILSTLSATSGAKVLPLIVPTNPLQTEVTIGGNQVPARTLLIQTLGAANAKRTLVWHMIFDPDPGVNAYLLSIEVVVRTLRDESGKWMQKPIQHVD